MARVAVDPNGHVDLPADARTALHVADGAELDVEVIAEGVVLLRGRDPEQAWYWREEWQAGERLLEADRQAGRMVHFDSEEAFDSHLRSLPAADDPTATDRPA